MFCAVSALALFSPMCFLMSLLFLFLSPLLSKFLHRSRQQFVPKDLSEQTQGTIYIYFSFFFSLSLSLYITNTIAFTIEHSQPIVKIKQSQLNRQNMRMTQNRQNTTMTQQRHKSTRTPTKKNSVKKKGHPQYGLTLFHLHKHINFRF